MSDGAGEAVMYAPSYGQITPGFTPQHPVVQDLCNGFWQLFCPLSYLAPDGRAWTVPSGFLTDFGSVPDIVDWIIPAISTQADPAYVLHDFHYACHRDGFEAVKDRADADQILYDALLVCGVARWRARLIWAGVRSGGWVAWNRSK